MVSHTQHKRIKPREKRAAEGIAFALADVTDSGLRSLSAPLRPGFDRAMRHERRRHR